MRRSGVIFGGNLHRQEQQYGNFPALSLPYGEPHTPAPDIRREYEESRIDLVEHFRHSAAIGAQVEESFPPLMLRPNGIGLARPLGPVRVGMVQRRQHRRDSRPLQLCRDGKERGRTQVLVSGDEEDLRVSSLQFPGGRG